MEKTDISGNQQTTPPEQTLLNVPINSENDALNVMVGYLNLAQRRGCFNIPESSKIWECIQKFQKQ